MRTNTESLAESWNSSNEIESLALAILALLHVNGRRISAWLGL